MKKLFLAIGLILLMWGEAKAEFVRANCSSLTSPQTGMICSQTTIAGGRDPGVYRWDGAAWVTVGGGHIIEDEGTPVAQRTNANFTGGGVTVSDSGGKTVINIPGGGAPAFDTITTGTNVTATMTVGTGGTLTTSGSGTIAATTAAALAANPTDCAANNFATTIAANGNLTCAQPSVSNLSDAAAVVKEDQTNVYGAFLQDFGAGTLELPNAAGGDPGTNQIIIDTTSDELKVNIDTVDKIVFLKGDPATAVANTPSGTIAATNVQAAINELDSEKEVKDPDLTNLAGLNNIGFVTRQGAADFEAFSFVGHSGVIDLTNPAGIAGAPVWRLNDKFVNGSAHFDADGGSTDDYVACPDSINKMSTPAYVDGSAHRFRANTANTGAATINLCGLGARNIVKATGGVSTPLASNDIRVNQIVEIAYRSASSEFQMQSTLGNSPSGGTPGGSDTQVQFNCSSAFCGDTGLVYNSTTDVLTASGGVTTGSGFLVSFVRGASISADRTYTADTNAAGDLVLSTGSKTTGNISRWDSSGRLVSAGSGRKVVEIEVFPAGTAVATGDGKSYFRIPTTLNGMNLVAVAANVITAGTTNATNVDIDRCAAAATGNVCSGTVVDMLSTNITIDSGENDTATAAVAAVIDGTNDDVSTGQVLRINVDAVSTTPPQGLLVVMEFELP